MSRFWIIKLCVFSLSLLFMGCVKEDTSLCINRAKFEIIAIWPDSVQKPEGIRVVIYPTQSNSYIVDNFAPQGGILYINKGNYSFLIHNNDINKVRLQNIKKIDTYQAYTDKVEVSSYKPAAQDEDIVDQPDIFWVANLDKYEIAENHAVTVYPQQIVKKYIFKLLNIKGLENIKAVRGTITGMMGTYSLNPAIKPTNSHSLYFDKATIKDGIIFDILSFGVVEKLYNNGISEPRTHTLTVEFMNKSEVRRYNFDVTHLLNAIPGGGEIDLNNEIEIPPGEDIDDGGFDAEIGNWDNVIVVLG